MALHIIPSSGDHDSTPECVCWPIRTVGVRPDTTVGVLYLHQPANYDDLELDDQEGRTDAVAGN